MSTCLLCGSERVRRLQDIDTRDLVEAYRRVFDINVSSCFVTEHLALCMCESCDLRFFDPPVTGNVEFYRRLSQTDGYYMENKPEFDIARDFIRSGDAVLEIGGGRGGFASRLEDVAYTGLEFNDEAIVAASRRGVRLLSEPIEEHAGSHSGRYDVVCAFQVLEHVAAPRKLLDNALKCLKPGGRLILSVPAMDSFLSAVPNLLLNMPPHHVTLWTDRVLYKIPSMLDCHMEHLVHEKIARYHYAWFLATALLWVFSPISREQTFLVKLNWWRRFTSFFFAAIGWFAALLTYPLMRRLPSEMLPNGHAVVAVMRKSVVEGRA